MSQPLDSGDTPFPCELCKDDYDQELDFQRLTAANWFLPDRKNYMPFGMPREEWGEHFLTPKLDASVPINIRKLFEVARGCMICSWYFYPLATLGFEQMTRVGDLAIHEKCRGLGLRTGIFSANLQTLATQGVISPSDNTRWEAVRSLRNDRSHPKDMMLIDPGQALVSLHSFAELINQLFPRPGAA